MLQREHLMIQMKSERERMKRIKASDAAKELRAEIKEDLMKQKV